MLLKYEEVCIVCLDQAAVKRGLRTSISSKQNGFADFLTDLVAQACMATLTENVRNFTVDSVRVVKVLGGSITDSEVLSRVHLVFLL